jgi:hypothetical protein
MTGAASRKAGDGCRIRILRELAHSSASHTELFDDDHVVVPPVLLGVCGCRQRNRFGPLRSWASR